ncbi:MAG: PqqD family protein [Francisellaceae bacterium]|jgi:hypothetical protein|nr:PqqD family protein [Francisellaceae bacterium]MBT6207316.1 PqqD family protein [Francisellaceae bacterium]MBT6538025.1 PqqD family protein [Francisellaceae bacterium]
MKLGIKPNVRIEQSLDKIVIIDDINGEFYECNETALFMIKGLFSGTSREALVEKLIDNYEIDRSDAHLEVDQCLSSLHCIGILNEQ